MGEKLKNINFKRTKYCGEFNIKDLKKYVFVAGWVSKQRDLGNLIFIDLRDRTGIVQLAIDDKLIEKKYFNLATSCASEFIICAQGVVRARKEKNPKLKTGDIEICVEKLKIISKSKTPPFDINNIKNTSLELTLKYRYLSLRNKDMQNTFFLRHKIMKHTRDFFDENLFFSTFFYSFI